MTSDILHEDDFTKELEDIQEHRSGKVKALEFETAEAIRWLHD